MLPLFVLETVLFPDCTLDLQLFEARYIDMVSRCMRQDSTFGVLAVDQASANLAHYGCEAKIIDWQQLDNGLLGIRVEGQRVFCVDALDRQADGLNLAAVSWLKREQDAPLSAEHVELALVLEALLLHPEVQKLDLPKKPLSLQFLADRLGYLLPLPVMQKSLLLGEVDPVVRLETLNNWIESMQA